MARTIYMDEMGKMTKGEILMCCAALNGALTSAARSAPYARPANITQFSLATVRAALEEGIRDGAFSYSKAGRRLAERLVAEIDTLLDDPEVQ